MPRAGDGGDVGTTTEMHGVPTCAVGEPDAFVLHYEAEVRVDELRPAAGARGRCGVETGGKGGVEAGVGKWPGKAREARICLV